ncbi:hypothetical protein CASFOL_015398 [Castilleja foliolosa]|uniref:DUF4283 domain-containing protein n=1 Tax=Castilleja foliolosa TaxID=1961234 RepID=A0ABD3DDL5_9LAMI
MASNPNPIDNNSIPSPMDSSSQHIETNSMDSLNLEDLILQTHNPDKLDTQTESESENAIITRILAPKPVNVNAFKTTILRAWNISGKITSNTLGDNKMAFIFSDKRDMEKVLNMTWTFRDHQLVIARWPPDKAVDEVNLDVTRFWVHDSKICATFICKAQVFSAKVRNLCR